MTLPAPADAHGDVSLRVHPNLARAGAAFMPADSDDNQSVDLFNGTLSLRIPISLQYPVGAGSAYSLALVYSSSVWEFEGSAAGTRTAVPAPFFDAGLGWTVGFSRLLAPHSSFNQGPRWLYLDASGRVHPFYQTVHGAPTDAAEGAGRFCSVARNFCNVDAECGAGGGVCTTDPAGQLVAFTRDGSVLRMRQINASLRRIEFPDGSTEDFAPATGVFRLTAHLDGYGNGYTLSYPSSTLVVLTDTTGRVQTLSYRADPAAHYAAILDTVTTTTFGSDPVVWRFTYDVATIPRSCEHDNAAFSATVAVPLLRSITQPDGTTHSFTYAPATSCTNAGRLVRHTLPTLGSHGYTYATRSYPPMNCAAPPPPFVTQAVGVSQRDAYDAAGTDIGTWTYGVTTKLGTTTAQKAYCGPVEEVVALGLPTGGVHRYYFSLDGTSGAAGANGVTAGKSEYGLPFARERSDSTGTRFISHEVLACASGCPVLRSTYSAFEQDTNCNADALECAATNRRLSGTKEVYWDDLDATGAARYKDAASSDYDGLGHYRTVTSTGTLGSADALVSRTSFVPLAGSWPSSFRAPSMYDRWLAETWSTRTQTRATSASETDACFDAFGGLVRTRTLLTPSSGPGPHDLVAETLRDGSGNVISERSYGGDLQTLPVPSDLCQFGGIAPQYRIDHTYVAGVRAVSTYLDAAGNAVPADTLHVGVDAPSGLVSSSTDSSGFTTAFAYDFMGRRIGTTPASGDGARTQITYTFAIPGTPERIKTLTLSSSGAMLAGELVSLDAFGRVALRQTSLPSGAFKEVAESHDAMGHLVSRTEPGASGSARVATTWSSFDAFGRWTRRQRGAEVITRSFTGARLAARTHNKAWAYGPPQTAGGPGVSYEAPETITEERDREGALVSVTQTRHGNGPFTVTDVTSYVRDLAGRPLQISVNGTVRTTNTIDGRGFVTSSVTSTPDQDVQWQWTTSSQFDARGHAHDVLDPINHRTWDYDAAERVVAVRDPLHGGRPLKEFVYGTAANDPDRRTGRLWKSIGHNWFDVGGVPPPFAGNDDQVVRELSYAGPGARVSRLTTSVFVDTFSGPQRQFVESRGYGESGDLTSLTYPSCTICTWPQCGTAMCLAANPGTARSLSYAWDQRLLISMAGTEDGAAQSWLPAIGYAPTGELASMSHADGTIDSFTPDPSGITRIGSVTTTYRAGPQQSSGLYEYDSGGSLLAVGGVSAIAPPSTQATVNAYRGVRPNCRPNQGMALQTYSLSPNQDACDPYSTVLKDADDRIVYIQDAEPSAPFQHTWRLYGPSGELMREFATDINEHWIQTADEIRTPQASIAREVRRVDDFGVASISTRHPAAQSSNQSGFANP
ncbi:MAG TPA: hypothetical protein VGH20_19170 [Myxococcales bacterium]